MVPTCARNHRQDLDPLGTRRSSSELTVRDECSEHLKSSGFRRGGGSVGGSRRRIDRSDG